jgi:hypothetical protein
VFENRVLRRIFGLKRDEVAISNLIKSYLTVLKLLHVSRRTIRQGEEDGFHSATFIESGAPFVQPM